MEDLSAILNYSKSHNYPPTNTRAIYVEYLQHEILRSIFNHTQKLSFIGGTSLRIVFGCQRFSEDLDFDNFGITNEDFETLIGQIAKDLNNLGFNVEFRNVYKGAYHCYFKFSDILYKYGFSTQESEKILVRLDTVSQDFIFSPVLAVVDKFGLFFEIKHNPVDILLSQKFMAALESKRNKGRDFYDITFLMSFTKPNLEYLRVKAGIESMVDLKQKLLKRCEEINFAEMTRDVQPFLFNPQDTLRITKFKQYVEGWKV